MPLEITLVMDPFDILVFQNALRVLLAQTTDLETRRVIVQWQAAIAEWQRETNP